MIKRLYYIILQRLYVYMKKNKPCQVKVYMFHNVDGDQDIYSISRENFEVFLRYLNTHKKIVDIGTMIEEKDPDNVVISFDDVYESVFLNAYPLLKEMGVPFYLFVANEYLDREGYLKTQQLKQILSDSRAIVGSHRYEHKLSRFEEKEQLEDDFRRSKTELEDQFGIKIDTLAFPYGSIYACSQRDIGLAEQYFDYILMTYALPYNGEYGNILPRININNRIFEREMK